MRYELKICAKNKNYIAISALLIKTYDAVRTTRFKLRNISLTGGAPLTVAELNAHKLTQKKYIAVLDILEELQEKKYIALNELEYTQAVEIVNTFNIPELKKLFQFFKPMAPKLILWKLAIQNSRIKRGELNTYDDLKRHGLFNGKESQDVEEKAWSLAP